MNKESCNRLPHYSSIAGYTWSSFLYSIRSDLEELKSSVSEGANELMTIVRDAIPESTSTPSEETAKSEQQMNENQEHGLEQGESVPTTEGNEESLSSRFSGFLSSTINKTRQVIQEVLEETSTDNNDM